MRNLILVSLIMFGMMSFSSPTAVEKNVSYKNLVQTGWEILTPQVSDLPPYYCEVPVYNNGVFVKYVGGFGGTAGLACANAYANACRFIEAQGGTCPAQQQ